VVVGRLKNRSWDIPEGDKRIVTEIDATEVAPSLKWAIASPEKPTTPAPPPAAANAASSTTAAVLSTHCAVGALG
jgi:single-strand DNA-binding protein